MSNSNIAMMHGARDYRAQVNSEPDRAEFRSDAEVRHWREKASGRVIGAPSQLRTARPSSSYTSSVAKFEDHDRVTLHAMANGSPTERARFEALRDDWQTRGQPAIKVAAATARPSSAPAKENDDDSDWDRFVASQGGIAQLHALGARDPDALTRVLETWRARKGG